MGRRAFTLIELLVVVGVIALLLAILLPALNLARDRARTVVCGAHLTQLALGLQHYMADNRGYYPGDHWQTAGTRRTYISWAPRIRKYAFSRDAFFCPTVDNAEARWNPSYDWTGEDVTWLGYEPGERP